MSQEPYVAGCVYIYIYMAACCLLVKLEYSRRCSLVTEILIPFRGSQLLVNAYCLVDLEPIPIGEAEELL